MKKIAIVFTSKNGQTGKIARYMETKLQERGFSTQLIEAGKSWDLPSSTVDAVICGSPVYAGKFSRPVLDWLRVYHATTEGLPLAFFTVALNAADKRPSARADDDRLLREFIEQAGRVPGHVASFAGGLKYRAYNWFLRRMMRNIAMEAGGDTDTSRDYEYTSWAAIDSFLSAFTAQAAVSPFATAVRFPAFRAMDANMSVFEQHWKKEISIERSPASALEALHTLPASEMRLARALTWLRTLGRRDETPADEPFLVSAVRFGNVALPSADPRELIAGIVGRFWELGFGVKRVSAAEFERFNEPGFAKVLCNYRVEPGEEPGTSRVISEMRVHCTSPEAARKFGWYWRFLGFGIRLYMGSALAALKRRALRSAPAPEPGREPVILPAEAGNARESRSDKPARMHENTQQGA